MRLEIGMLIKTNYSGPYRIKKIIRGCTCQGYIETLSLRDPPLGRPHIDIVCTRPDRTGVFYLNRWDEDTLRSLDKTYCGMKTKLDYDVIEVMDCDNPVQMTLF